MDENFRRLYEGTFPVQSTIKDPLDPCPARLHDRGLRSHRLKWESDHYAVCRDCGGVYFQKEKHG